MRHWRAARALCLLFVELHPTSQPMNSTGSPEALIANQRPALAAGTGVSLQYGSQRPGASEAACWTAAQ